MIEEFKKYIEQLFTKRISLILDLIYVTYQLWPTSQSYSNGFPSFSCYYKPNKPRVKTKT